MFGRSEAFGSSVAEYLDTSGVGSVRVPHGDFLLSADFGRMGPHLSLSEGETTVVVKNFFTFDKSPDLTTESGHSVIDGSLAVKLAGPFAPGQFAQVGQLAQAPGVSSIGTVEKLAGTVTLTRIDGTTVQASKGTAVFSGDVIKTDASANIGIKFVDDTSFSLGESGRMVIDEMIYDPSNNSNSSSSFSVVKGVFSFVSGQVAKAGDDAMVVTTPVASIGIRGTTVAGKAAAEGSSNSITLLPDADGGVGQIAVSNSAGTQIMSVPFQTTSLTSAFTAPAPPVIVPANQLENLYGTNITTVLPPASAQQGQQKNTSNGPAPEATDGPSGEGETQEGEEEGETPEGEGEAGEGEEAEKEQEKEEEEAEAEEEEQEEEGGADAERPPGEAAPGDAPPGETGEAPPGEGDGVSPGEVGAFGEGSEQGPGEGPEGGSDDEPQQTAADQAEEEQDNPNRYGNARDAFEDARESGLSEEEAFEKAASAVGVTEKEKAVAEAAFQKAIEEGADPREAVWAAEDAVREEFDQRNEPKRAEIEATSASIEDAIQRGATAEDALRQQISGPGTSRENLDIAREAAYQSLDNVFRNDDAEGLAFLIDSTEGGDTVGEDAFRDALLEGKSIDEAFGAAFEANVLAAGGAGRDGRVDFLAADLFIQGFDPGLRASALIREVIDEIRVVSDLSEGTISIFNEIINATTGNDVFAGAPGDNISTQFFMVQGSTMGGNDTLDGGGGQDEIFMQNLSDILLIADFSGGGVNSNMTFSTKDGSLTGAAAVTGVEQMFFESDNVSQRLGVPFDGRGFAIAGTSLNDTIDLTGDGSPGADLTFGSLTIDLDANNIFGSIIFGGNGNDTITSSGRDNGDIIFGGDGDDLINSKVGDETIVAGDGDDTIVVASPDGFFSRDGTIGEDISGGSNTSVGDTLQIGDASTSTGQTFIISTNFGESATVVGIENLHFFKSNTTLRLFEDNFVNFDKITAESGVSGIALIGASQQINLSTVDVTSAVTSLTAISSLSSGVRVFDANDSVGRTLIGTDDPDTLSGFGGDDIFQMGGGRDVLSGGAGNDTFEIAAETDIVAGIDLSGGGGTDKISLTSTSISSLVFPENNVSFATLESFDLSGGAASGVAVTMAGSRLQDIPQFVGDGTTDAINVSSDNFNAGGRTLNGIEQINLTGSDIPQRIQIDVSTSITGLDAISGTINSSAQLDDEVEVSGDRDFSGITFTNIKELDLADGIGVRQTLEFSASSSLDLALIRDFTGGAGSTTDRFNYGSNLLSGNGSSNPSSSDLTLTEIGIGARAPNVLSSNFTGAIDFETTVGNNNIGVDFKNSTLSEITTAVEVLLESTNPLVNLTGTFAQMKQGVANTDSLLIFYDNDENAAIIRYQEGLTSEADFSGELSVVAIFENPGGVATFDNANII